MNSTKEKSKGWHCRGYLPHYDDGSVFQFVTFRLHDSVPAKLIKRWSLELEHETRENRARKLRQKLDKFLDSGYGECHLKKREVAQVAEGALLYLDKRRYKLRSWVVMPNHIHFLAGINEGESLSSIMKVLKGYTAREINKIVMRSGKFWQNDYFDRYIRGDKHYHSVVKYIENNPVKAKLCSKPRDWEFGSARRREAVEE